MAITLERKKGGRPTVRPDAKTLVELYSNHTASQIGEMYGVPASTVRYWVCYYRRKGEIVDG